MDIQYDFSGQTAIVTGGARGIGRAISAQFVRFGAQAWIWDVDPVELDGAQSLAVDVTKADETFEPGLLRTCGVRDRAGLSTWARSQVRKDCLI
jgi:NAD(P)-dependent dehydrogenase (short-subunit alcohol dehydrogenase family)